MRGVGIHFDFRGQIRFCERLFQNALLVRRPRIVISCNRNQEVRLAFRSLNMWTVRLISYESTAVERCGGADARVGVVVTPW